MKPGTQANGKSTAHIGGGHAKADGPNAHSPAADEIILLVRVLAHKVHADPHKGDHIKDEDSAVDPMQKSGREDLEGEGTDLIRY